MVARALEWLDVRAEDRVWICSAEWEFYAAAGNARGKRGRVEGVQALVEKGRENAIRNGLHNVTFFHENRRKMSRSSRGRKTALTKSYSILRVRGLQE